MGRYILGLCVLIQKYSFVFLMLFLQKLLNGIFVFYLQRKDIDNALIDRCYKKKIDMRSDESFESLNGVVKSFIEEKCSELDVAIEFKEKRVARK